MKLKLLQNSALDVRRTPDVVDGALDRRRLLTRLNQVPVALLPLHEPLHDVVEATAAHSLVEVRNAYFRIVGLSVVAEALFALELRDFRVVLLDYFWQLNLELIVECAVVGGHLGLLCLGSVEITHVDLVNLLEVLTVLWRLLGIAHVGLVHEAVRDRLIAKVLW